MKNLIRTALAVGAIGLLGVPTASAQLAQTMTFKTTFPFTVGKATFSPGTFTIRSMPDSPMTLEVSNGKDAAFIQMEEVPAKAEPVQDEVVFERYHNTYVITQVWDSHNGGGLEAVTRLAELQGDTTHGRPETRKVPASRLPKAKS